MLVRFQWNRTVAHHPSHARPSAIIQPRGQMLALNAHFVISSAAPTALILRSATIRRAQVPLGSYVS